MADFPDRKKLVEKLPALTQSFGEIQEIMRVEEKWMNELEKSIGRMYDNAFIEDCDEYGIRKYESLLGIIPDTEDKMEIRKSRVLARWNNAVPYTYRSLICQLNSHCGVNNYDIDTDLGNYRISISTYISDTREIKLLLDKMLPQNIVYDIWQTTGFKSEGNTGIVWQDDEIFTLRQVVI